MYVCMYVRLNKKRIENENKKAIYFLGLSIIIITVFIIKHYMHESRLSWGYGSSSTNPPRKIRSSGPGNQKTSPSAQLVPYKSHL